MIYVQRSPAPTLFNSPKISKARDELKASFEKADRQERLRFDNTILQRIRPDLLQMFQQKCAYCESRLVAIVGELDHFRPRAGSRGLKKEEYAPNHYWWLAYEWDNLLISCQLCNGKYKRDFFPLEDEKNRAAIGATGPLLDAEQALLINPCADKPSEHLVFDESGYAKELTKKGKITIEILGLNRLELVESRKNASRDLLSKLESLEDLRDLKSKRARDIIEYVNTLFSASPYQEYSATLRSTFDNWYEKNSNEWENIKISNSVRSSTKRMEKSSGESFMAQEEISSIERDLTELKRFSIRSVEIENFKSIEKLTLSVPATGIPTEGESWLLVLGDNGIGKSSILQAIALALAGKKQLKKLRLNVLDFLRRGESSGKIVIRSFQEQEVILNFDANGFKTDLEQPPTFILGYGSTRLLPKGKIIEDQLKEPYTNIRNLFDYSFSLTDSAKWIASIDSEELSKRVVPALFDVLALKDGDTISFSDDKIKISQFGDIHDLENSSDGFKTVVALVADMMKTLSTDQAGYHNSSGIVLIDEIGTHLHPRWRLKIVGALRKAFPRLQFIVTTHEPLCLRGLAYGEVNVLMRDKNNAVRVLDSKLLPDHSLMRIDELLTSDLFGLLNVMDETTEKKYEEYYTLLSKKEEDKSPEDFVKIEAYVAELSEKELLGTSPVGQEFFKIFNNEYAQKLKDGGYKTKSELKKETVEVVKNIIEEKKIDWL